MEFGWGAASVAALALALAIALLGHGFLWTGLVNRLHGLGWPRPLQDVLTKVILVLFVVIPPLLFATHWGRLSHLFLPHVTATPWAAWGGVGFLVLGVGCLVAKFFEERNRYDHRVQTDQSSDLYDLAEEAGEPLVRGDKAERLAKIPGNQATLLSVDRRRLLLAQLPAPLAGLRVVHLSDLHMTGRIDRRYFELLAEKVNAAEPDVIAVTGDIVENPACWEWLATTLGKMEAKLGRYFVLGNHDEFIDASVTIERLCDLGWTYVGQEAAVTSWRGAPVCVLGNELRWRGPAAKPPVKQQGEFRLALTHSPDQFPWCVKAEADLALAGHTHGGQFQFPVLGPLLSPSLRGTRHCCGVFRRNNTVLHVTRGVGGKLPLRLKCLPELAVLELATR